MDRGSCVEEQASKATSMAKAKGPTASFTALGDGTIDLGARPAALRQTRSNTRNPSISSSLSSCVEVGASGSSSNCTMRANTTASRNRHRSPRGHKEQHPQKNAHKSHASKGCLRASSVRCALPWASPRHVAASAPSGLASAKGAWHRPNGNAGVAWAICCLSKSLIASMWSSAKVLHNHLLPSQWSASALMVMTLSSSTKRRNPYFLNSNLSAEDVCVVSDSRSQASSVALNGGGDLSSTSPLNRLANLDDKVEPPPTIAYPSTPPHRKARMQAFAALLALSSPSPRVALSKEKPHAAHALKAAAGGRSAGGAAPPSAASDKASTNLRAAPSSAVLGASGAGGLLCHLSTTSGNESWGAAGSSLASKTGSSTQGTRQFARPLHKGQRNSLRDTSTQNLPSYDVSPAKYFWRTDA
mmetsp:Transcript_15662/g.41232  ORF Transcript_15662/g.41232 Transcript_15662/m.41232 type:complete len:415 (-) Transcript_15662:3371-4615(-)